MARNPSNTRRDGGDLPPTPRDEPTPKNDSDLRKPSFWVNVITLIVIAIYTCFACNQVQQSQTANSIAKKASAETNKPYVMYTSIFPNFSRDPNGTHIRIGWTLTNYGNTPASYLRFTSCDPIIMSGLAQPDFHCTVSEKASDEAVLGPKQAVNFSGPIIEPNDLDATTDNRKSIYLLGSVTYQDGVDVDANGRPEQRETRFCQRIAQTTQQVIQLPAAPAPQSPTGVVPQAPPAQPQQLPPGVAPVAALGCPAWNCMDDGCPARR